MKEIPGYTNPISTAYRFLKDSEGLIKEAAEAFGETFRLKLPFGDVLVISHPTDIKAMFSCPPDGYEPMFKGVLEPLLGSHSLFMQKGDLHKHRRNQFIQLLSQKSVAHHADTIESVTLKYAARHEKGESFDAEELMRSIVIEIMIRFVFGEMEEQRLQRYIRLGCELERRGTPVVFLLQGLKKFTFGLGPWKGLERIKKELDEMIFEDIASRRAEVSGQHDLLSKMVRNSAKDSLPMSDLELRDQILTIILAGFGTTVISLAWTMFWLHHTPGCPEKLRESLSDFTTPETSSNAPAQEAPYLEATIKEGLRINPVVSLAISRLKKPLELRKLTVPANSLIGVSIWMAHRRGESFEEPESFMPERFMTNKFTPFEYLPFGGGTRRCVGATFAEYEMKIILATLIRHYEFKLQRSTVPRAVNRHLFVSPEGGVPMTLRKICS